MNFIIGLLAAARGLTFLTNLIGAPATPVHFTQPELRVAAREVRMSLALENAYPDELKKLAGTGTVVPLYVYVELLEGKKKAPVNTAVIESRVWYDLINREYRVTKNFTPDTMVFQAPDSALAAAARFENFAVFNLDKIQKREKYSLNIYAVLGKARVEALEGHHMDLMYYWDFKRPSARTEPYAGNMFFMKQEG